MKNIKEKFNNLEWKSLDGRRIKMNEMSHQHLSNCYWYNLIFFGQEHLVVLFQLNNRFNGDVLSWKPYYKWEVDELIKKDFAVKIEDNILIYENPLSNVLQKTSLIGHVKINELK